MVQNTARKNAVEKAKSGRSGTVNVQNQAGAMTEHIREKEIQKEAYRKLGITPELLKLQDLRTREVTGA